MINLHDQVHIILIGPKVGIPPIPNINEFILPTAPSELPQAPTAPSELPQAPTAPNELPLLLLVFLNPNLKKTMKTRSRRRFTRKRNRNY